MNHKILINGITSEDSDIVPLVSIIKCFIKHNDYISVIGNSKLQKRLGKNLDYINIKKTHSIKNKYQFIFESIRRNIQIINKIETIKNKYHYVYSISSVLDLIIFPYILKIYDKKIKWITILDNIVPFKRPGKLLNRLLSYIFFEISIYLMRKADLIFVKNKFLFTYLIKRGFNKPKIIIINNGIETDLIKKAKIKKKYKIDALYIGRINEAKGIYDMLKVLNKIKVEYPNFQLYILGEGDNNTKNRFIKEINRQKLNNNIKLLGYISGQEKYNLIKTSKCFLFLSFDESFGVSLLEAVSSGIPAFTYNLPAYKNIYHHNEIYTFKKGDINSVSKAIIKVFKNKQFKNENGKKLLGKYNWENIVNSEYLAIKSLI